jgi:hypothetical protein
VTDTFIDECVVDGGELLEAVDADETGVHTWFWCKTNPQHSYRAAYDGMRWSPVDQGDYDDD